MEEKLIYVNKVCQNSDNTYEYDLLFSDTPEIAWGADWADMTPNTCSFMLPDSTTYNETIRVRTKYPFTTIQETSCYSMEYALYGAIALAWIDLTYLEDYPSNGRCVLKFGEDKDKVIEKLINSESEIIENQIPQGE